MKNGKTKNGQKAQADNSPKKDKNTSSEIHDKMINFHHNRNVN